MTDGGGLAGALVQVGAGWRAAFVSLTLATALILAAAWLMDRLLARRVSAAWRLLLYLAVLVRVVLPVGWQSPLGLFSSAPAAGPMLAEAEPVVLALEGGGAPAAAAWGAEGWLGVAYLLVAFALLVRLVVARARLERQLGTAIALPAASGHAVWRHPSLGPFVAGLLRPRIVLPAALADADTGADAEARALVLRHELAHLRRRDPWLSLLLQLGCCLAWPLVPLWIAARRVRALMEEACDERAVADADGPTRRRYGEVLLALAEERQSDRLSERLARRLAPALGFPALGSPLRSRLRALGRRRRWPAAVQASIVAAVGALALACGGEDQGTASDGAASDGGDAVLAANAALRLDPALAGPHGPGPVYSVPGYRHGALRSGPTPGPGAGARLLESKLSVPSGEAPASSRLSPEERARRARLRETAPTIRVGHDATWLCTARGGCSRMGGWKPLHTAIRDALRDSGARTVLIDAYQYLPLKRVQEVMSAAKQAGAQEFVVSNLPLDVMRGPTQPQLPSAQPGAPAVPYSGRAPVLSITKSGEMYLGRDRVTLENLESELRAWLAHSKSRTLLIRGDKSTLQRSAVDVMAVAKRAGASNIGILSGPPAAEDAGTKRGSLDKEIIRKVISDHISEVKACYETRLARRPDLGNVRMTITFTIGADGTVTESALGETSITDAFLSNCLVEAVRTWTFPAPEGGGIVIVTYPFSFAPKSP